MLRRRRRPSGSTAWRSISPPPGADAHWCTFGPAPSALQHAVYDVWVEDCLNDDEAAAERPADEAAPEIRQNRAPPRRRPEG